MQWPINFYTDVIVYKLNLLHMRQIKQCGGSVVSELCDFASLFFCDCF